MWPIETQISVGRNDGRTVVATNIATRDNWDDSVGGEGGTLVRAKLAVALAALAAVTVTPASAGPLDPPSPPPLRVLLFEPTTRHPAPLTLNLDVAATQDDGAIMIVGFQPKGKRRLLFDGVKSTFIEARRGGVYPSAAMNGSEQLPSCPADVLCSVPAFPPDIEQHVDLEHFTLKSQDAQLRYYVFINDVPDVTVTPSNGWRQREVKGGKMLQFRDAGTEVRVNAPYRQEMVEDFQGVTAPRVNGESVAFATIPCFPPPAPDGTGRAVLHNDGKGSSTYRTMNCTPYKWGASGAAEQPTVWSNDGASLGWTSAVNNLTIAVLPAA